MSYETKTSNHVSNRVLRHDWFVALTGMTEVEYRKRYQQHTLESELNVLDSKAQQSLIPLQTMRQNYDSWITSMNLVSPSPMNHRTTPLILLTSSNRNHRKHVSVGYLQSRPENQGAVFLVASNFNGLEAISSKSSPEQEDFLTNYAIDLTQGPAASISAGKAAIDRYFCAPGLGKQTTNHQVNILSALSNYLPVKNGYITLTTEQNVSTSPYTFHKMKSAWQDQVYVYVHRNVQVTFAETEQTEVLEHVTDPNQRVDQVFAAALNIGQGSDGKQNYQLEHTFQWQRCRMLLEAAIEGAYLVAIEKLIYKSIKPPIRLYLTPIGTGAFGNRVSWLLDAIYKVHCRFHRLIGDMIQVYLVCYSHESKKLKQWREYFRRRQIECSVIDVK